MHCYAIVLNKITSQLFKRCRNMEGTEKVLHSFLTINICTYLTLLLVVCRYFSILCATNSHCHVSTATRFYTQPLHRLYDLVVPRITFYGVLMIWWIFLLSTKNWLPSIVVTMDVQQRALSVCSNTFCSKPSMISLM